MQKTDIKELRKELKKAPNQDGIIDWVYAFYVNNENEMIWSSVKKFYNMEDEDKFRHSAIINKVFPASIGKDLLPVQIKYSENIANLRNAWKENEDDVLNAMEDIKDTIMSSYSSTDPYYATISHVLYDVPTKASDGAVLEDENTLFDTLIFALCPAKLSAPALGYDDEEVHNLSRRWTVGAPVCGFMYPSFSDRGEDVNEAAFFIKKGQGYNTLHTLFEVNEDTVSAEEQKIAWNGILSELELSTEEASAINESICEYANEHNSTTIEKESLKHIIEETGVDCDNFDDLYETLADNKPLSTSAIAEEKIELKTDSAKIQTGTDMAQLIQTRVIDGVPYILVPADGVITVNGARVRLKE